MLKKARNIDKETQLIHSYSNSEKQDHILLISHENKFNLSGVNVAYLAITLCAFHY